jgi:hypothetical protein
MHPAQPVPALSLALLGVLAGSWVPAAEPPPFVGELAPSREATVLARIPAAGSDLLLLDAGWEEGLATGMRCVVEREGEPIAAILLAAARLDRSVGLLLAGGTALPVPGDRVRVRLEPLSR